MPLSATDCLPYQVRGGGLGSLAEEALSAKDAAAGRAASELTPRPPKGAPPDRFGGGPNRRRRSQMVQGALIHLAKEDEARPLHEQLRNALARQAVRVIDLFKQWDMSQDMSLSRHEFLVGVRKLGLPVDDAAIHQCFDEWDVDGSGTLALTEFNTILRRGSSIALPSHLRFDAEKMARRRRHRAEQMRIKLSTKVARALVRKQRLARKARTERGKMGPGSGSGSGSSLGLGSGSGSGGDAMSSAQRQVLQRLGADPDMLVAALARFDTDGDASVSRREFHLALPTLGVQIDKATIDALYDSMDINGDGQVSLTHVAKAMRDALVPGSKLAKRQFDGSHTSKLVRFGDTSHRPLHEQLHDELVRNAVRVLDFFRDMDSDGNGEVDRAEFAQALPLLGLHAPPEAVAACFDLFDKDGAGTITFRRMNKLLREAKHNKALKTAQRKRVEVVEEVVQVVDSAALKFAMMRECSKLQPVRLNKESDDPYSLSVA